MRSIFVEKFNQHLLIQNKKWMGYCTIYLLFELPLVYAHFYINGYQIHGISYPKLLGTQADLLKQFHRYMLSITADNFYHRFCKRNFNHHKTLQIEVIMSLS